MIVDNNGGTRDSNDGTIDDNGVIIGQKRDISAIKMVSNGIKRNNAM